MSLLFAVLGLISEIFMQKKKSHSSCSYFNDKIQFLITSFFVWQDALYREQMLENKLANLQRLISDSKGAVEDNTQVVAYGIGVFP